MSEGLFPTARAKRNSERFKNKQEFKEFVCERAKAVEAAEVACTSRGEEKIMPLGGSIRVLKSLRVVNRVR